jgi:TM2 domain-containing membrane protein YozV
MTEFAANCGNLDSPDQTNPHPSASQQTPLGSGELTTGPNRDRGRPGDPIVSQEGASVPEYTLHPSADARAIMRYDANKKSVGIAYLLWFFFGALGAHRFYLRRTGSAVAMLLIFLVSLPLTLAAVVFIGLAVVGVCAFVDLFLIPAIARSFNNQLITELG